MLTKRRPWAGGLLGLCLLRAVLLYPPGRRRPNGPSCARAQRPAPRPPHGPWEAALREARQRWLMAQAVANRDRDAVEAWDATAAQTTDAKQWRAELMLRDRSGDLSRALIAAQRAASLAGTPEEAYQATLWLALIEHDGGDHAAELQHARRLMVLAPHNKVALLWLRQAARCNDVPSPERRADAGLRDLRSTHAPDGARRDVSAAGQEAEWPRAR